MWQVRYEVAMTKLTNKDARQRRRAFGFNPEDPAYTAEVLAGASQYGEKAVDCAKEDLRRMMEMLAKESFTDAETMELSVFTLNMFIVKLNGGGLLLYAPVRIREETGFADWVDSLGRLQLPLLFGFLYCDKRAILTYHVRQSGVDSDGIWSSHA